MVAVSCMLVMGRADTLLGVVMPVMLMRGCGDARGNGAHDQHREDRGANRASDPCGNVHPHLQSRATSIYRFPLLEGQEQFQVRASRRRGLPPDGRVVIVSSEAAGRGYAIAGGGGGRLRGPAGDAEAAWRPRQHIAYWLKIMTADNKAVFTAAATANQAL